MSITLLYITSILPSFRLKLFKMEYWTQYQRQFALAILTTIIFIMTVDQVSARRGGGFRGGFRSGRYGSSSRSSSTRLSLSQGSRVTSTYIKYVPRVRYSRSYTSKYNTYYYTYYSMYFHYSGSAIYLSRPRPAGDVNVCANYEANENGTTMGVFTCPNSWEPEAFKSCCGVDYAEFCCEDTSSQQTKWMIGSLVTVGIIGLLVLMCKVHQKGYMSCKKQSPPVAVHTRTTTILAFTTTSLNDRTPDPNNCITPAVQYTADNASPPTSVQANGSGSWPSQGQSSVPIGANPIDNGVDTPASKNQDSGAPPSYESAVTSSYPSAPENDDMKKISN